MRWANFLSMFHFQIVHVDGKKNVVADALSRKPRVSAVSIVFHDELINVMKEQYTQDEEFCRIYDSLTMGERHNHYSLRDEFLLMHGKLCVTKAMRAKVLTESHAPPYAGHRDMGILTLQ